MLNAGLYGVVRVALALADQFVGASSPTLLLMTRFV